MSGNRRDATWVGEVYVLAVFGAFVGESAPEAFEVPNKLPSLHSDLDLFDQDFILGQFREIDGLADQAHCVDEIFASFF